MQGLNNLRFKKRFVLSFLPSMNFLFNTMFLLGYPRIKEDIYIKTPTLLASTPINKCNRDGLIDLFWFSMEISLVTLYVL